VREKAIDGIKKKWHHVQTDRSKKSGLINFFVPLLLRLSSKRKKKEEKKLEAVD